MPADDEYKAVTKGGLKLKGVQGSKVDKQKKKRKKDKPESAAANDTGPPTDVERPEASTSLQRDESDHAASKVEEPPRTTSPPVSSKTEAERRHEEQKRKRLDERLKREGVKTHKERVEELNRYLSSLSEHHDMPRIGPG